MGPICLRLGGHMVPHGWLPRGCHIAPQGGHTWSPHGRSCVRNSCSCSSCWLYGMAAIWLPQGCHAEPHGWLPHGCHLAPLCRPLAATSGASPPGVAAEGITAAQLDCRGFVGRTSRGLRLRGWCQANLLGQMVAPMIVPHRPQLDGRNLQHSCSLRHQDGTAEDDTQQHQGRDGDGGPRQHRDGMRRHAVRNLRQRGSTCKFFGSQNQ